VTLTLMPVGDSITRGSYLATYGEGPFAGQAIGLPHPSGGGWRRPLQERLRAAGVAYAFAGELDYGAYGVDGRVDSGFDPRHHGLAGFGNQGILDGGVVPTPRDVLTAHGLAEVRVPGIAAVLTKHQPDIVLLMAGANGFDAEASDRLIQAILAGFAGRLLVATIPPQAPPRAGYEQVEAYNASLAGTVAACGRRVALVDIHAALRTSDLLPDGVHPNQDGMVKIAATWWSALAPIVGATT
jgi:hypothetical protein